MLTDGNHDVEAPPPDVANEYATPEPRRRRTKALSLLDAWTVRYYAHKHCALLLEFPGGLFQHWRRTARDEFKDLPLTRRAYVVFSMGLVDFFSSTTAARDHCMLPSSGVDSVWHAWMQFDNAHLEAFCVAHFGKAVPHVEVEKFSSLLNTETGLVSRYVYARVAHVWGANDAPNDKTHIWFSACAQQNIPLNVMPYLFQIDHLVRVPHGYGYSFQSGFVVHHMLGADGIPLPERATVHMGLCAKSFVDLGLIDEAKAAELTGQPYEANAFMGFAAPLL